MDYEKTKESIDIIDGFTGSNNKAVVTTKGWRTKVKWRDGSYDWLPLSRVKGSNSVELVEYAFKQGIEK